MKATREIFQFKIKIIFQGDSGKATFIAVGHALNV
jgi:hypothetical protein